MDVSIKQKISLYTGLTTLMAILLVTLYSLFASGQLFEDIQHRSETLLLSSFDRELEYRLGNGAAEVEAIFKESMAIGDRLAAYAEELHSTTSDKASLRDSYSAMLKRALADNPQLLGTYMAWEPNALDGRDRNFSGRTGYDDSGRFIPYFTGSVGNFSLDALVDYDNSSRPDGGDRVGEYYLCPKDSGRHCLIEPYLYPIDGQQVLLTSLTSPIKLGSRFVGVAGVDIALADLNTLARRISGDLYGGAARVLIITGQGMVAADSAGELQMKDITHSMDHGRSLKAQIQAQRFDAHESEDGELLEAVAPIYTGANLAGWGLYVSVPKQVVLADLAEMHTQASEQMQQQILVMILVGALAIMGSVLLIWWLAGRLAAPILEVARFLEEVAGGNFTQRLTRRSNDETGDLADACNRFLDQTQPLIRQVIDSSDSINSSAEQSSKIATTTLDGVNRQQEEVLQLSAAADEMSASAHSVAGNAVEAAEMTQQTHQAAQLGQGVLQQASEAITQLEVEISGAAAVISELQQDSQNIHSILDVIRDIADQTNLLALNAAIEAARAGDQGRGFAVVADEVRSLAQRTQTSTEEIHQLIERLNSCSSRAVAVMESSREKVGTSTGLARQANQELAEIIQAVDSISDLNTQVASAAEQQSAVAEDISRNLGVISTVADSAAVGAREASDSSHGLQNMAVGLRQLVQKFQV